MSYRFLFIWIFCFSTTFILSGYSQNKIEKEYRIKSFDVPKSALDFMDLGPFDKKIKWYAEESLDGNSIEAKTCFRKRKYSIEFDLNGNPQDVEQKIPFKSLKNTVQIKIKKSLDSIFVNSKIKKTQKQYVGSRQALISLLNKEKLTEGYDINYELIVKGKKIKLHSYYELLFDNNGKLLKILKIVNANTDNLIY